MAQTLAARFAKLKPVPILDADLIAALQGQGELPAGLTDLARQYAAEAAAVADLRARLADVPPVVMPAAVVLPIAAALPLRRSWLARALHQIDNEFAQLLRELVPGAVVEIGDPLNAYWALLDHLSTLFPVYEPATDFWEETTDEENAQGENTSVVDQALYEGIPVKVLGLSFDDARHYAHPALMLAAYLCSDCREALPRKLEDIPGLEPILERKLCQSPLAVNAPRGRQWSGAWVGLPDLVAYVRHETGCSILDYGEDDYADGMEQPEWDIDEIRGLIADWKRGKPMWARIEALVSYIGKDRGSLLDLGRLLTGDPDTRRALSTPKRGQTLGQIFAKEARHAQV
jgi:hypothetical protein